MLVYVSYPYHAYLESIPKIKNSCWKEHGKTFCNIFVTDIHMEKIAGFAKKTKKKNFAWFPHFKHVFISYTSCLVLSILRLRHIKRAIARARLCRCLKHWIHAQKKNTPCLIKKASRCAADRTLKQQVFYLSLSIKHKDVTRKSCVFVYYFIGSVVKMVLSEAAAWGVL